MVEVFLFILFLHHSLSQETDFELDMLLKYGLTIFLTLFYKMTLAMFKFWWFMLLSWRYATVLAIDQLLGMVSSCIDLPSIIKNDLLDCFGMALILCFKFTKSIRLTH